MIVHMYFQAPGQQDAVARAAALGAVLMPVSWNTDARYAPRISGFPAVVCDHGDDIVVIPEPTTLAAVNAAHDALLEEHIPIAVAHRTDITSDITTHAGATNPHGITPAGIGAAAAVHNHDAAYSLLAHTHAVPSGGALRKTANQTMTLTAQTAVTDMAFAVAANATYYFQMELVITTSTGTAPTTAWGFTGPASPVAVGIAGTIDTSTSIQVDAVITSLTAFAAGAQVANTGAKFAGVVQTNAAGTVALTVARAGTTPSMVIAAGSNGFWLRVA